MRRNFSPIGKEIQERVIHIILKENDADKAAAYFRETVRSLRGNEIPVEKMIITTQLTKDVSSYDSVGPHVSIAQKMIQKGIHVKAGSQIRYVIVKGGGRIRDKARLPEETLQSDYDAEYYLNNQVYPSIGKIFEVLGPRYQTRSGGYARIIPVKRRKGDGAEVVRIEFVQ